jgi:hypothetical protein
VVADESLALIDYYRIVQAALHKCPGAASEVGRWEFAGAARRAVTLSRRRWPPSGHVCHGVICTTVRLNA